MVQHKHQHKIAHAVDDIPGNPGHPPGKPRIEAILDSPVPGADHHIRDGAEKPEKQAKQAGQGAEKPNGAMLFKNPYKKHQ